MGTISQKLEYLDETRELIRTNINALGNDITEEDTFRSYADALDEMWENQEQVTGTGTSLSLNTKKGKMKLKLTPTEMSQEGTPTPDTPQTIHTISGDNEIVVCGKNLVEAIITHTNISAEGKIVYHNDYDLHIAKIVQGKTYTMTTTAANDKVLGFFINYPTINSNTYNNSRTVQISYTFTAPITGYVAFRSATGYSTPMLNEGTTALPYEPYQSQTYEVDLPVENLFDTINVVDGEYYNTSGNEVLNGDFFRMANYVNCYGMQNITISGASTSYAQLIFYDENKNFLDYWGVRDRTITVPNNAYYFRASGLKSEKDTVMIQKGTKANHYTPYGTTPIELGWIGDYKDRFIRTTGKNLLSINDVSSTTRNGITYSIENNVVVLNGTSTATTYIDFTLENIIPSGEVISYSANNSIANNMISVRLANGNNALETMWLNEIDKKRANYTLPNNMDRIYVVVENNTTLSNFVIKLMANKGDTALPYEPYGTNEWYLEKKIGKKNIPTFNELKSGTLFGTPCNYVQFTESDVVSEGRNYLYYGNKIHYAMINNVEQYSPYGSYVNNQNFVIMAGENDTLQDMNNKVSGSDLYFRLATPTYTPITGTLKDELEAVWRANSYKGQTNISQVNNDLPFELDVRGLAAESDGE